MARKSKKKQLILVSHTHWDREWYLTFQEFRLRLIHVIDKALELGKDPRWNSFMLDGQTAPVEDYLEIKPDEKDRLIDVVTSGNLIIGPWYVLADEFLESAEGLVRNLMIGHQIAERFGKVMKVGYVPDTFGHVWQLPQILSGFSIHYCYMFRGYPPLFGGHEEYKGHNDDTPLEFSWVAPDGTKVLTLHHITGYGNTSGLSDVPATGEYAFMGAITKILMAINRLEPRSVKNTFLLMNGTDHLYPDTNIPELVAFFNQEEDLSEEMELKHGTLEEYFHEIGEDTYTLEDLAGEMRGSAYTQVTPACLSSRMYLKQQNWLVSNALENYVEPLNTFAWYLHATYPKEKILHAWKLILKNHPHDSICGCSIDRVHDDMELRFAEVDDILQVLVASTLRYIVEHMAVEKEGKVPVVVFNCTGWNQDGPVSEIVSLPLEMKGKELRLVDHEGNDVQSLTITDIPDYRKLEQGDRLYPFHRGKYHLHRLEFIARGVPCFGYKTFYLMETGKLAESRSKKPEEVDACSIENPFLKVVVKENGSLDILQKSTGKWWKDMLLFEDAGDDGDEYDYAPTRDGVVVVSSGSKASIVSLETSAFKQECRLQVPMLIPRCIDKDRNRAKERVEQVLDVVLTLNDAEPFLRVMINVDNHADDHRVRALFPSRLDVKHSHAADHFMVMKRDIALPKDDGWFQPAQGLYHTDGFVDLSDGKEGLSVHVKGLPEFEILGEKDNAIAITLFRSVGWLSQGGHLGRPTGLNGPNLPTPGAQCRREMSFELAIQPHEGNWKDASLYKTMKAFHVPMKGVVKTNFEYFYEPALRKEEPRMLEFKEESLLQVKPADLVVSAIKKAEEEKAVIIRLFNPTGEELVGSIHLSFKPSMVSRVNLNEEFLESVMDTSKHDFHFGIKPNEIITFSVVPEKAQ